VQVSGHSSKFRAPWVLLAVGLVIFSGLVVTYQLAFVHRVGLAGSIAVCADARREANGVGPGNNLL
jgi:hypothetical protein